MKATQYYIILSLIFLWIFSSQVAGQNIGDTTDDEILIISSYNSDTKYNYDIIREFINSFNELNNKCDVIVENMNQMEVTAHDKWVRKVEQLVKKHPKARLLILIGGEAWNGYLYSQNESLRQLPAICIRGSRYGFSPHTPQEDKYTYMPDCVDLFSIMKDSNVKLCYAYTYDIEKNIKLAQQFYPDLRHIALLSDNTYSGVSQLAQTNHYIKKHKTLKPIYIDGRNKSLDEAVGMVKELPVNSALLLATWRIDSLNITYVDNSSQSFKTARPQLPVFSITSSAIGYWALGGYCPNYDNKVDRIVKKAYEIMYSDNEVEQELTEMPLNYRFDELMMQRFGIQNKVLPKGSIIINKAPTFWQLYKRELAFIILAFIFLSIALIVISSYYFKTITLKNKLIHLTKQLQDDKVTLEESKKEMQIAKESAEKANQMKSTFVSNISHEIRTPLNSIVGFSSLLVNSVDISEEEKEYAALIQSNSDLLLKLIDDVLNISRLESGKLHFKYKDVDIINVCQNIISTLKLSTNTNITIELKTNLSEFHIYTDQLRIQQVITNLLNNALKFTPAGGHITLGLKQLEDSNELLFSVTDTGSGIPHEKQELIFERFEKLNEFVQGTGLGLSICKLILKEMKGRIWIDKEYKNGARFYFTIPMNEKH